MNRKGFAEDVDADDYLDDDVEIIVDEDRGSYERDGRDGRETVNDGRKSSNNNKRSMFDAFKSKKRSILA